MIKPGISFGDLVAETVALIGKHAFLIAAGIAGMTAIYVLSDIYELLGFYFVLNLVLAIWFQYLFTEQLTLDRQAEPAAQGRRYGALFGASLLSGAAIVIGYLLLIVPGMYLSGRWMQSSAQIVVGRKGATEALNSSWAATEDSQLTHFLAGFLMAFPSLLLIAVNVLPQWIDGPIDELAALFATTGGIVALNVITSVISIVSWVVGIASFRLTDTSAPQAAVFE